MQLAVMEARNRSVGVLLLQALIRGERKDIGKEVNKSIVAELGAKG